MQASKRRYTELVGGAVQFVIPVFQRDYNWAEEHCEQLWNDIIQIGEKDEGDHFFGPVVYISTEGQSAAFTRWLLIDGQQRMTTVSLLVTAVRDHIRDNVSSPSEKANKIAHDFLTNTFENDSQQHKLVLRERDESTFRSIIGDTQESISADKSVSIVRNYQYFRDRINAGDVEQILKGVSRLAIVDVRLDRGRDDPQQIFESLNSTGLDLTQADLVRNYVLMGLEESLQTKFYQKYWKKIELLYVGSIVQLDNFFRDFVALKTKIQKQGRADQIYAAFRLAFKDQKDNLDDLEDLLIEMITFARYHAAFVMGTGEFVHASERLSRLRPLATTPAILVMRLLDAYEHDYLTSDSLNTALDLIESYIVRRDVCGLRRNSYWKQFAKIAYGLRKSNVFESLKVQLYWLSDSNYSFPTNREFLHALEEEELYGRQICRAVLDRLENANSKERSDTSAYTIEHIMPQNEDLSAHWRRMLGQDWKDVHSIWLHRLGNLTLTAYNEKYSDMSFEKKKTISDGFNDSPLRLNQFVAKQNRWTAKEIRKRGKILARRALDVWPLLTVSEESLREATVVRLRASGGNIKSTRRDMDKAARKLFDALQEIVKAFDRSIIEVAAYRSVSYFSRNGEFFCEIVPRTRRILLLLEMEVSECRECDLEVIDAADYQFIQNACHDAGCFVSVVTDNDVEACEPLLRQALAMTMD